MTIHRKPRNLKLRIKRGIDLAKCDFVTDSDPYVVVTLGDQKKKTCTVNNNHNPKWDTEFTISVQDENTPIHLAVFDEDTMMDDKMGDAHIDLKPYLQCLNMSFNNRKNGDIVMWVEPQEKNCLAEKSRCIWNGGKISQEMKLKLRNIKRGYVVVEISNK